MSLALGLACLVNAKSSTGNSVLVVVEQKRQDDFHLFYEGLKGHTVIDYILHHEYILTSQVDQGYELTFRSPKDEVPAIIEYDEASFAHVVILASETKSG